jgi:VCBS repeat-containing protein
VVVGDVLGFATQNGITGVYTSGTGVLTLSGTATLAQYQAALRSVTYKNTSEDPTVNSTRNNRIITWSVTDANSDAVGAQTSADVTSTINLTAVNDKPVVTAGAILAYTENASATVIDSGITISDADDTQLTSAMVTISSGFVAGDILGFTDQNGITGSYSSGVLNLSGTATLAQYQAALQSVTYGSTSEDPTANNTKNSRTITWTVTDADSDAVGSQTSVGVTSTINLTAVNDTPVVTAGGTLNYTENMLATVVDSGVTITDVDDTHLASATVAITSVVVGDLLGFATQNGITGVYTSGTGVLALSGTATLAQYQAALQSVTYRSTREDPTVNNTRINRIITWAVTDANSDAVGAQTSTDVTSTINLAAVNDKPLVTAGAILAYTENSAATVIDSTIAITDVDDIQLTNATVTISSGFVAGDILGFTDQNGITGSYNSGVLNLSGTATLAQYQAALQSVTYGSTSEDPTANNTKNSRTITWAVTDADSDAVGAQTSTGFTSTINLTALNDKPLVTAGATLNYVENAVATVIDAGVTIADLDDTALASATVTITNVVAGDVLVFINTDSTTFGNISGSYSGGVLTLTSASSTATLAQWQEALRSVTYNSNSDDPTVNSTRNSRTITWTVTDANSDSVGAQTSAGVTSTINLTAANNILVVTAGGTLNYVENNSAAIIDAGVTLSDADDTNVASAIITITSVVTGDVLGFTSQNGITGVYTSSTGVLALSGTATLAQYQAALRSVTYLSTNDDPTLGNTRLTRTINWVAIDANSDLAGATTSATVTSTVNIAARNDAPVLTVSLSSTTYIDTAAADVLANVAGTLATYDVDTADTNLYSISGQTAGTFVIGLTSYDLSKVGTYGTLYLESVSGAYEFVPNNIAINARTSNSSESFTLVTTDNNNASDNKTFTINITAANDTPLIVSVSANHIGTVVEASSNSSGNPVVATPVVSDTISASDADTIASQTWSIVGAVSASYGTIAINPSTGVWTYTLDNTLATTQALTEGQTVTQVYTSRITDNFGAFAEQTITVTIIGSNDAPIVVIPPTGLNPIHEAYRGAVSTVFRTPLAISTSEVGDKIQKLVLTVSNVTDDSSEKVSIAGVEVSLVNGTSAFSGGTVVASVAGTTVTLTVNFTLGVTTTEVESILTGITYRNVMPAATVANRVITLIRLFDNGGGYDSIQGTLATSTVSVVRESVVPVVTSVTVPANGFYRAGQYLTVFVTMSEDVLVTGAPSIDVVIGATTKKLVYSASDSSSTSLAFKYLLVTGDVDNDGVQLGSLIDLNSGSITDLAINSAALALVNVPSTLGVKVNLPPVGFNDTGIAFEMGGTANGAGGSNATGNLISNDTDNENDLLTVTVIRLGQVEGSGVSGVLGSPLNATYGSLTVNSNGSYIYVIDETNPVVDALNTGDTIFDFFNYTLTDGSSIDTATFTITIQGTSDAPVVTNSLSAAAGAITEAGNLLDGTVASGIATATGTLTSSDVDTGATKAWSIIGTPSATYGGIVIDSTTGVWVYSLDNTLATTQALIENQVVTQSYTARVTDDKGAYVDQTIIIAITGTNDTPTVSKGAASATLIEDSGIRNAVLGTSVSTILLTKGDVDGTANYDVSFLTTTGWATTNAGVTYSKAGNYGSATLTIATNALTYVLNNSLSSTQALTAGQSVSDSFTLQVTDTAFTSSIVPVFDIIGSNDAPELTTPASPTYTDTANLDSFSNTTGNFAGTDVDSSAPYSFGIQGPRAGAYGVLSVTTAGAFSYKPNASAINEVPLGSNPTDTFVITISDGALVNTGAYTVHIIGAREDLKLYLVEDTGAFTSDNITSAPRILVGVDNGVNWEYNTFGGPWTTGANFGFDLPDGSYRAGSVQARITGTTTSTSNIVAYKIDTFITMPTIQSTGGTYTLAKPPFTGTAEPSSIVELFDTVNGVTTRIATRTASLDGKWNFTPTSNLIDGNHPLKSITTDLAGNISESIPINIVVDTIAPNTPTINSPLNIEPMLRGTAESGATVMVTVGVTTYRTFADVNGAWGVDLINDAPFSGATPTLPGSYSVRATATDASGNQSAPLVMQTWTITLIPLDTPVITSTAITRFVQPTIEGTAKPLSIITLEIKDATNTSVGIFSTTTAANGRWSINLAGQANAPTLNSGQIYNVSVLSTMGNLSASATSNLQVLITIPGIPVITSGTITNDNTPTITGTANPSTLVLVTVERELNNSVFAGATIFEVNTNSNGTWVLNLDSAKPLSGPLATLRDGRYRLLAKAVDFAGNQSANSAPHQLVIDNTDPLPPTMQPFLYTNVAKPLIVGTGEPNSVITLTLNNYYFTTTVASNRSWSVDTNTATPTPAGFQSLVNGTTYQASAISTDLAGNSSLAAIQSVVMDNVAPVAPIIISPAVSLSLTPTIEGIGESGTTAIINIDGTIYRTNVSLTGDWSFTVPTSLAITSHSVGVTLADAAGNISPAALQNLLIDPNALPAPVFTSARYTNNRMAPITGTARPGSSIALTISDGASLQTFSSIVANRDGAWQLNFSAPGLNTNIFTVIATATLDAKTSAVSTMILKIDKAPPVINSIVTSFGSTLNLAETTRSQTATISISDIEDGKVVGITLNSTAYQGIVNNGIAIISIPATELKKLTQNTSYEIRANVSDFSGNVAIEAQMVFLVDIEGPARPNFQTISVISSDIYANDAFTADPHPVVTFAGESGQGIVIYGPQGVVSNSLYTMTESPAGTYSVTFSNAFNLTGAFNFRLVDSNGNQSPDGPGSQDYFQINSAPILYDMISMRQTSMGNTYGNLGAMHTLNGEVFLVPQAANGVWTDLDGELLTVQILGGATPVNNISEFTTSDGAHLFLDTISGAYAYTPVAGTIRTDRFLLALQDTSGNSAQMILSFSSIDSMDRDGIMSSVENSLADKATALATGDMNHDGILDNLQNAVSTFAWGREAVFLNATNPDTVDTADPTAIICMVVNSTPYNPETTTTLQQLMSNVDVTSQFLEIKIGPLVGSPKDFDPRIISTPWDMLIFSVESLLSSGMKDVNPDRPGTQIQVSIDISAANLWQGIFGLNGYRKEISQNVIDSYADAGIPILNFDGVQVTTPGWYDFTSRELYADGGQLVDFDKDGKLDAIILTLTDNSFGDNDPTLNLILDPGAPVSFNPVTSNPGGSNPNAPSPPGTNLPVPRFNSYSASAPLNLTGNIGTPFNTYSPDSTTLISSIVAFPNFLGEVRFDRADFDNDGSPEIIASMGIGSRPIFRVLDGVTGVIKLEVEAYDSAFAGGMFISSGDFNGDNIPDIVTSAGAGGGSHIKLFNGIDGKEIASFFAYDLSFLGGASVAVADVDLDGFADIITGAGEGGGPHVKVFSGKDFHLIKEFMAFDVSFRGGVIVAVGDYLSDGKLEIITGAGAGGGPNVRIYDYITLNIDGQFMAYDKFTQPNGEVIDVLFNGGVNVALSDVNNDNILDLITGPGKGGGPHFKAYTGFDLKLLMSFFSGDESSTSGIFVSR